MAPGKSALDYFLDDLKLTLKRNTDALEKIQKNTSVIGLTAAPSFSPIRLPGDIAYTDFEIAISRPFFLYVGFFLGTVGEEVPVTLSPAPLYIRFTTAEPKTPIIGGTLVAVPNFPDTNKVLFTAPILSGSASYHLFLSMESADGFKSAWDNIPFINTSGYPQRGTILIDRLKVEAAIAPGQIIGIDASGGFNKVRLVDAAFDEADIGTGGGDGGSASVLGLQVYNRGHVFNGSSWDRQRGNTKGTWVNPGGGKSILLANLNFSTNGDNTILSAAGGGIRNKILGILLYAAAAVTIKLTDGAAGSNLIGPCNLTPGAGGGFVLPIASGDMWWSETSANTALVANLSAAIQVGGCIVYLTEA